MFRYDLKIYLWLILFQIMQSFYVLKLFENPLFWTESTQSLGLADSVVNWADPITTDTWNRLLFHHNEPTK